MKMKNILSFAVILAIISCSSAQPTAFSDEALSQKLQTIDGGQLSFGEILKNYEGKTVLIEVWASWCGDCVKAMPKIKELQKKNSDVVYVFISMDRTVEGWKTGMTKHDLVGNHFFSPDGMKGAFGKAIDLDWIPRYIVIDKTGKIALFRAIETDFDKINTTLKSLK
jgi:thiol-disulfide isomerase/thioredoxin